MKTEDPIHLLKREHSTTLEVVDRMEIAVEELAGAHPDEALNDLQQGLQFLEREVRSHAQLEERTLYPALARHVPKQTIEVMLEEHRDLGEKLDLLSNALEAHETRTNEIRWMTLALVDLIRRHVDKENNVIFLMTAQMLSNQEYQDLTQALAAMLEVRGTHLDP